MIRKNNIKKVEANACSPRPTSPMGPPTPCDEPFSPSANCSPAYISCFCPSAEPLPATLGHGATREMVGAAPVCPPERPRSGVSIRKGHIPSHKGGVSLRRNVCALRMMHTCYRWMRPRGATRAGTQAPPLPTSIKPLCHATFLVFVHRRTIRQQPFFDLVHRRTVRHHTFLMFVHRRTVCQQPFFDLVHRRTVCRQPFLVLVHRRTVRRQPFSILSIGGASSGNHFRFCPSAEPLPATFSCFSPSAEPLPATFFVFVRRRSLFRQPFLNLVRRQSLFRRPFLDLVHRRSLFRQPFAPPNSHSG